MKTYYELGDTFDVDDMGLYFICQVDYNVYKLVGIDTCNRLANERLNTDRIGTISHMELKKYFHNIVGAHNFVYIGKVYNIVMEA